MDDPVLSARLPVKRDLMGDPMAFAARNCRARMSDSCSTLMSSMTARICFTRSEHYSTNTEVNENSIIGLSDGLTVPFALTAGLSSPGESRLVVVGGVVEFYLWALAGPYVSQLRDSSSLMYTYQPSRIPS
jgi:hypothetical protein